MERLPVVLMRFSALAGSMLLLRWYSSQRRQLLLMEEHWLYGRHTIVIVAEVFLERIGARTSRVHPRGVVGVLVSCVVRVGHDGVALVTTWSNPVAD